MTKLFVEQSQALPRAPLSQPPIYSPPPAPALPTVPAAYDGGVRGAVFRVGHRLDPEPDPSQAGDQVCQVLGSSLHCALYCSTVVLQLTLEYNSTVYCGVPCSTPRICRSP